MDKPKPKRGRPPKLDDTKRGQILGVLSVGGCMATAAAAVGCCVRTIYNTAERDPKFKQDMLNARAMDEVKMLKCIDNAAEQPKYWRAAVWKLERLHPERYRPQPAGMFSMADMHKFTADLIKILCDTVPDDTLFDHIIDQVNARFAELSDETTGSAETLFDRALDPPHILVANKADKDDHPPPADAA